MIGMLKRILATGILSEKPLTAEANPASPTATQMAAEIKRLIGRALTIRQIDAGSCNACELEINALNNPYYNLEGYGIKFVASPRHADMLLVTGAVTKNMEQALKIAYDCTPAPKLVIAAGDCAANGGIFCSSGEANNYACCGKVANVIPVDAEILGCPPTPTALLQGILTAISSR